MTEQPPDDSAKELARFPDITPDRFVRGYVYVIESDDIHSREELEKLLFYMHDFAERKFLYYCEKDTPFNKFIVAVERTGVILYRETTSFFYRHPLYKRDYVHIVSRDGTYPFDWEREVVEKGPMFFETTLALTERERRRRDVADLARKPNDPSPIIFKPTYMGMGFDGPAAMKWLKASRIGRWIKRLRD